MLKLLIIAILAFNFLLGSCNRKPATPRDPRLGGYVISGYDSSGQFIFTGTMSIISLKQNHLKGECTISRNQNAPKGILDHSGPCEGMIDGNKVELDFAPSLDDAGLLFEGSFDGGRFHGVWKLDGFATSPPLGKFEAVKTFHSF